MLLPPGSHCSACEWSPARRVRGLQSCAGSGTVSASDGWRMMPADLAGVGAETAVGGVRYPPNVRGLKSSWFVMLALLPVALMTYSPWRSAYTSAASSAFRYATAP